MAGFAVTTEGRLKTSAKSSLRSVAKLNSRCRTDAAKLTTVSSRERFQIGLHDSGYPTDSRCHEQFIHCRLFLPIAVSQRFQR